MLNKNGLGRMLIIPVILILVGVILGTSLNTSAAESRRETSVSSTQTRSDNTPIDFIERSSTNTQTTYPITNGRCFYMEDGQNNDGTRDFRDYIYEHPGATSNQYCRSMGYRNSPFATIETTSIYYEDPMDCSGGVQLRIDSQKVVPGLRPVDIPNTNNCNDVSGSAVQEPMAGSFITYDTAQGAMCCA